MQLQRFLRRRSNTAALHYKEFYNGEVSLYPIGFGASRAPAPAIEWYLLPFPPVSASWLQREQHHWVHRQREARERAVQMDINQAKRNLIRVKEEPLSPERPAKVLKVSPTKK